MPITAKFIIKGATISSSTLITEEKFCLQKLSEIHEKRLS
jgi:hypothetical protein